MIKISVPKMYRLLYNVSLKILEGDFSVFRYSTMKCYVALTLTALANGIKPERAATAFKQFIKTGETEIPITLKGIQPYKVIIPPEVAKRKKELQQLCNHLLEMKDRAIAHDIARFNYKCLGVEKLVEELIKQEEQERIDIDVELIGQRKRRWEGFSEIMRRKSAERINKVIPAFREYLRINERTKDEVVEILRAGLPNIRLTGFGTVYVFDDIREDLNIPGLSLKEVIKAFGEGKTRTLRVSEDGKLMKGGKARKAAIIPFEVFIDKLYGVY